MSTDVNAEQPLRKPPSAIFVTFVSGVRSTDVSSKQRRRKQPPISETFASGVRFTDVSAEQPRKKPYRMEATFVSGVRSTDVKERQPERKSDPIFVTFASDVRFTDVNAEQPRRKPYPMEGTFASRRQRELNYVVMSRKPKIEGASLVVGVRSITHVKTDALFCQFYHAMVIRTPIKRTVVAHGREDAVVRQRGLVPLTNACHILAIIIVDE
eukprot:PhM_4_TR18829/c0_g1_i3/m.95945